MSGFVCVLDIILHELRAKHMFHVCASLYLKRGGKASVKRDYIIVT
jgi:hypothetical protein